MEIRTNPIVMFTDQEWSSAITTLNTGSALVKKAKEAFPKNDISNIYIEGRSLEEIHGALAILDFLRYEEADIYTDEEIHEAF